MTDERFDIVDSEGIPLYFTASRTNAHRQGLWHATVHLWLIDLDDNILLQKRSCTKDTFPGRWDISCAGHREAGDSALDAVVRETREELGLSIQQKDPLWICRLRNQSFHETSGIIDNEHCDLFFLRKEFRRLSLSFSKDEIDEIRWVHKTEFRKLVNSKDTSLVPHASEYRILLTFLAQNR